MMNDKQTKATVGWQRGLSRGAIDNACIDELIDYEFKKELNEYAIRRNFILAISICVVALIVETRELMWISFVFIGLWGHSLVKGIKIQKKILELKRKVVNIDNNEIDFVYAEKEETTLPFRERMFALHREYLVEEEAEKKRKQVEDER